MTTRERIKALAEALGFDINEMTEIRGYRHDKSPEAHMSDIIRARIIVNTAAADEDVGSEAMNDLTELEGALRLVYTAQCAVLRAGR